MMKTKSFLLIFCLFAGAALMPLSAKNGDRTVNTWEKSAYATSVFCDGTYVDYVMGTVDLHLTVHYNKKGELVWEKYHFKGEVTSYYTGETFEMMEFDKYGAGTGVLSWRYHLKGSYGSHYIGTLTYNFNTGEFSVGKTVCH